MTRKEFEPYEKLFKAVCIQAKNDYLDDAKKVRKIQARLDKWEEMKKYGDISETLEYNSLNEKDDRKYLGELLKDMTQIENFFTTVGFKNSAIQRLRNLAIKKTPKGIKTGG